MRSKCTPYAAHYVSKQMTLRNKISPLFNNDNNELYVVSSSEGIVLIVMHIY